MELSVFCDRSRMATATNAAWSPRSTWRNAGKRARLGALGPQGGLAQHRASAYQPRTKSRPECALKAAGALAEEQPHRTSLSGPCVQSDPTANGCTRCVRSCSVMYVRQLR